jgi:hypothetical protein
MKKLLLLAIIMISLSCQAQKHRKGVGFGGLTSAPSDPGSGDSWLYYDSGDTTFYWWNGTGWVDISASSPFTASNGITLLSNDFKLGGALSENTTITYDGTFNINLLDSATSRGIILDGDSGEWTNSTITLGANSEIVLGDSNFKISTGSSYGFLNFDDLTSDRIISFQDSAGIVAYLNDLNNFLENIVEDTSPELGGNLDVSGNQIVSSSNGNILIQPDGTGKVSVKNIEIVDNNDDAQISINGGDHMASYIDSSASYEFANQSVSFASDKSADFVQSVTSPDFIDDDGTDYILAQSSIDLSNNITGKYYTESTSSSATFTISSTKIGGWATILISRADEPVVTGATKIKGADFIADTPMYLIIRNIGYRSEFFFLQIAE